MLIIILIYLLFFNKQQDRKNFLPAMIAEGLGFKTKTEIAKAKIPLENCVDVEGGGVYPNPQSTHPKQMFIDYFNGFNSSEFGVFDPEDPNKVLSFYQFIDLLKEGRTVTQKYMDLWVDALSYLFPCQRMGLLQGLPEGSRDTEGKKILSAYFSNHPKPKKDTMAFIADTLICREYDEEVVDDYYTYIDACFDSGPRIMGHTIYCDFLCNDLQPKVAKQTVRNRTNTKEVGEWPDFYGKWTARLHKTPIKERYEHYFQSSNRSGKIILPENTSITKIKQAAHAITRSSMFRSTTHKLPEYADNYYWPAIYDMIETEEPIVEKLGGLEEDIFSEEILFVSLLVKISDLEPDKNSLLKTPDEHKVFSTETHLIVPESTIRTMRDHYGTKYDSVFQHLKIFNRVKRSYSLGEFGEQEYFAYEIPLDWFKEQEIKIKQNNDFTPLETTPVPEEEKPKSAADVKKEQEERMKEISKTLYTKEQEEQKEDSTTIPQQELLAPEEQEFIEEVAEYNNEPFDKPVDEEDLKKTIEIFSEKEEEEQLNDLLEEADGE